MKNIVALGCGLFGIIFLGIAAILVFVGIGSYNSLVSRSQNVDKQWAQVQADYQRRADLIPNLVNTVSGAANFEKSTLVEVTEARASVGQMKISANNAPNTAEELASFEKAQGQLSSALSRLLVVSERYPDLKANSNFRDLQAQIEGTENRITVARRDFNEAVSGYNITVKRFPTVFFANWFNYKEKPYFASTPGSETAPKVNFDFGKPAASAPAKQ